MANVVDFAPLRQRTGYADLLDPVAEAAQLWSERRHKKSMQDAVLNQKREVENRMLQQAEDRNAHVMRQDNLAENRTRAQYGLANSQERARVMAAAKERLRAGDVEGAQAMAANHQEIDPVTGELKAGAIPFKAEAPAAPAPVVTSTWDKPPVVESYSDYHEQPDSLAASAAAQKPYEDAQAAEAKLNQERMGQYQANKGMDTMVTLGDAPAQSMRDIRYGPSRQAASDFDRYVASIEASGQSAIEKRDPGGLGLANRKLETAKRLREAVATGQMKPDAAIAQVEKGIAAGDAAGVGIYKQELGIEGANERQRIANQRPHAPSFAGQNADVKEKQYLTGNFRNDKRDFFQRWNAKTTEEGAQEFPNIEKMLNSGNGKLQQQALITMMRLAQKDNRFSDADAKMAMNTGAGWLDQAESWFSKGATGSLGADVLQNAAKAARVLNGFYQQKNNAMLDDAETFLTAPDLYSPRHAGLSLSRELPGFKQRHPEFSQQQAAPAPGKPARKGNGLPPNLPIPGADRAPQPAAPAGGAGETPEQRRERLRNL